MSLPTHVAVILDGNRRWARSHNLPAHEGHLKGLTNVRPFLDWCVDARIRRVTLWLLSTDNLTRRRDELVPLFTALARTILGLAQRPRWRLHHIGAPHLLSADLTKALDTAVDATCDADGIDVNLAIGYGGRHEIAEAARSLALQCTREHLDPSRLTGEEIERLFASHLMTAGQPEPDLIIRTSGEVRLSGFLIWQAVHSELYFSPVPWPEFTRADLSLALDAYASRHRRLGA